MPENFLKCVRKGGKVITKDLGNGKFIKICYINGTSYAGEVEKKEGKKEK